ncbi:MAG: hypothetical protein EBR02_07030 [Alphaproteobacteria bacterium]|nr:hypothetical protein [Alphaproteobacteria bacterium]
MVTGILINAHLCELQDIMQEQRLIVRLQAYWELLRKGKPQPAFAQLNSGAISDLWPNCILIGVDNRGGKLRGYKYEYIGEEMIKVFGHDYTGTVVDMGMKEFPGIQIAKHLPEIVATGAAQKDESQFNNSKGHMIKYRCCFLPFGDDKRGVTNILIGVSHRVF